MNLIDRLQIFVRVAELNSFTQTADDFGIPKASVSTAVKELEAEIGTRLFHRTTRKVALTHDGNAFYSRSTELLAEIEDAQTMFHQKTGTLQGRVRIDMSTAFARFAVIPKLPQLVAMHPLLEFEVSSTERFVDLVSEGFDCVLRGGTVTDTSLIARPVGHMRMVNCASPAYLGARGTPATPADLSDHRLVHFVNSLGGKSGGFEYVKSGNDLRVPMAGAMTVNNADAYSASCLAGLGIIQVPYVGVRHLIATGQLIEVLKEYTPSPMPLSLIYANRRNLSRRVRFVMDWLADVITEYLAETASEG